MKIGNRLIDKTIKFTENYNKELKWLYKLLSILLLNRKKTKLDLVSISLLSKAKRDYMSKVEGKRITITDFNWESIL